MARFLFTRSKNAFFSVPAYVSWETRSDCLTHSEMFRYILMNISTVVKVIQKKKVLGGDQKI